MQELGYTYITKPELNIHRIWIKFGTKLRVYLKIYTSYHKFQQCCIQTYAYKQQTKAYLI